MLEENAGARGRAKQLVDAYGTFPCAGRDLSFVWWWMMMTIVGEDGFEDRRTDVGGMGALPVWAKPRPFPFFPDTHNEA